jgi:hypothetical protein
MVKDSGVLNQMGSVAKGALMSSGNPYGVAAGTAMGALGFGRPGHRAIGDRVA